nr:GldG family protein [Pedosphaera parvula]
MVAAYIITSAVKVRVDVTADKAHTLSSGTKNIIGKLNSHVTLRFYCTQADNAMPPALRTYARHIEDLLGEYKQQAKDKLVIQKFDPKPDSDAEDSARLNGVEGRATGPFGSAKIYLGMVASMFDEKFALPWLPPERERLLEYDISRAIGRVANRKRPVIGIMTGLPVYGEQPSMLMHPGEARAEEWAFVTELKKDFTIKDVPLTASNIDDDINVLLVAHPVDISDTAQYAIDQFVLRGGKLLAFLDPHAYFDQKHDRNQNFTMAGDNAAQSSLDKLLKAWGLEMDVNRVAADTSFASRNLQSGDTMPTLLLVTRSGINENDVATSQIDNLVLPFAGAFMGKPAEGLKETVLVKCSPNSELVDSMISTAASEQILRNFKPSNVQYPLAIQLTGKFKTAFPDGKPKSNDEKEKSPNVSQLKESKGRGDVILVADTDMLNDKVCVRVQNAMGHRTVQSMNGNLNFIQSLVEQFAGDDDLISSRSRASMSRPFTRVKDMQAKAGKQWEEKVQILETKQRETEQRIKDLRNHKEGSQDQSIILSPAQEQELEKYQQSLVEVSKDLKLVRKKLSKDTEALEFWTKVMNIGTMPIVVAISGLGLALIKPKRRGVK